MAIRFNCPQCQSILSVDEQYRGRQVRCGKCQSITVAEEPNTTAPPVETVLPEPPVVQKAPPAESPPTNAIQEKKRPTVAATSKRPPKVTRDSDEKRRSTRRPVASSSSPFAILILLLGIGFLGILGIACIGGVAWWSVAIQRPDVPLAQIAEQEDPLKKIDDDKNLPEDQKIVDAKPGPLDKAKSDVPPLLRPVKLGDARVERMLPSTLSDICVGGGGRFLCVQLPNDRKVALFDANEGKIVHYFPLAGDNARIAAGRTHLFMAFPGTNVLQRWNLMTREKELTLNNPFPQSVESLTMGCDSNGPIHAALKSEQRGIGAGFRFFDMNFKIIDVTFPPGNFERPGGQPVFVHASHDGTLFGCRDGVGGEPHPVNTLTINGNAGKTIIAWISSSTLIPSPDGRFIYSGSGVYTPQMKLVHPQAEQKSFAKPYLPSTHGPYFMRMDVNKWGEHGGSLAVFFQGNFTPFATIPNIEGVTNEQIAYGGNADKLTYSKRVFLIPGADLLVSVPKTNDRLVLHQVNINTLLEKSPIDYLLIASAPPRQIARGKTLTYALDVRAKKGGVRFTLDSAPQGMTLSPQGILRWPVPVDHPAGDENVIITVRDAAGQEAFHTFRLRVD